MDTTRPISRRSVLLGAAGAGATGLLGGVSPASAFVGTAGGPAADAADAERVRTEVPLWRYAVGQGLVYGSSTATWQIADREYRRLFRREAAILFTEDDLLWWRLKPTPKSRLNFKHSDRIIAFAHRNRQLVLGAHLVWDEGFGDGWTDDDLWGLSEKQARHLLYGTVRHVVHRYRGRVKVWSVANEVTDPEGRHGLRTNVPWYHTIGPEYVADAFHIAHHQDPKAHLLLNEFGFETVNQYGDKASDRRRATLQVLDKLLKHDVPVHGLGIQAHLLAHRFEDRFHAKAYRAFLSEVADRGLKIHITEMDVLDDGLPADRYIRDHKVADVYHRFLDVALDEPAVKTVINFGLSDRYTWLDEDYPRDDGHHRRPLPFDRHLQPKPAHRAIARRMGHAPHRHPLFHVRKGHHG